MRALLLTIGVWGGVLGCLKPAALEVPPEARAGARSALLLWDDPSPTYWLVDLDQSPNLTFQRSEGVEGVRALFYGCPAAQLNIEPGLQQWSSGCVPETERHFEGRDGRLVPAPADERVTCGPCLLSPLRVTKVLPLPEGHAGAAGLFLDDDTVLLVASAPSPGWGLFRVELNPPSVTRLSPRSGVHPRTMGPLARSDRGIFAVVENDRIEALTLGPDSYESRVLGTMSAKAAEVVASTLFPDGDRLLFATGFGALWSFTEQGGGSFQNLEPTLSFSVEGDHAIITSMQTLGTGTIIGVGVTADPSHYVTREDEGYQVPFLRRYFLLQGDRVDTRPLPDGEEPVSMVRTAHGRYLVDRRGATYPVDEDGRLGALREVANGSDLGFAVAGDDRLFYAGREGTIWQVFPEKRAVCEELELAFGSVVLSRGRHFLQSSGPMLTFAEVVPAVDCSLAPVPEQQP